MVKIKRWHSEKCIFAANQYAMGFIEELRWRGMLHDITPGLEDELKDKKVKAYIGFDPTAPSLTIGNYVQIMILKIFQQHGHHPIVLMGGATGRIGDPSGKDQERQLKSYAELDANLNRQKEQFLHLLDFKNENNPAIFVNNLDFYKGMNVLEFLRIAGKTLTINYMLNKESVQNRIEKGISFTEFSYQILQGYDFQQLFEGYDCVLQMGGSDQWGNITSGIEFIRRNLGKKAFALTTPLLTKSDGSKFGKSAQGNIWLDPNMTSPYKFYQFWINSDDQDLAKFFRYFSLKNQSEIEKLERELIDAPRKLKKILAEELTIRIHGEEAFEGVKKVSELLFNPKADYDFLQSLKDSEWNAVASEIPSFTIDKSQLNNIGIIDFLSESTGILKSKGDVRRAIKGNAISINKQKIQDFDFTLTAENLLVNKYILAENGKKNKFLIIAN